MRIQLFEVVGGWGYDLVTPEGVLITHQEFDPLLEGRQTMDQATAQERAESEISDRGLQVTKNLRHISTLAFLQRLTPTERLTIRGAETTDPVVRDFLFMFQVAQYIDLDEPTNRQALGYFASKGWIQAGRVDELLA